jgi:DNA replication protein DnaC
MNPAADSFGPLAARVKRGDFHDPNGSQEPPRTVSECRCGGKGFLARYNDDSVIIEFVSCVCTAKGTRDRHMQMCVRECRIDEEIGQRFSFDTWGHEENPLCNPAFFAAKDFAEQKHRRWLFLRGISGLGKTHLAIAAVYALAQQGVRAEYWRIQDLVAALFVALKDETLDEMIRELSGLPVLAIDDYGAAHVKDFAEAQLERILDSRHFNQMPTLITTNDTLDKFTPRLRSRLKDPLVVDLLTLEGSDVRPRLERG